MPLRLLGLCGADDSVDPRLLMVLSQQYAWLEWGVLFRPDKEGEPRYASPEWVERLAAARREFGGRARLAAHLCSTRVDEVLRGDASFCERLRELGFGRVQVNATAVNGVDMSLVAAADACERLLSVIRAVPSMEFILQRNAQTQPLWAPILARGAPPNVSVLFDESMGTGQLSASFPAPLPGVCCGFAGAARPLAAHACADVRAMAGGPACPPVLRSRTRSSCFSCLPALLTPVAGGLGPSNLEQMLQLILGSAGSSAVWVDMESSLRTCTAQGADTFDVAKCFACAMVAVDNFGMPSTPEPPGAT